MEQKQKSKLSNFSRYLEKKLTENLPGHDAHLIMSPVLGTQPFRGFEPTPDAKSSAVLIIFTEIDDEINILFTLRSLNLNSHGGQISFPGGRIEADETIEEAALRETMEEINLSSDKIKLIGRLSQLFVPPSNSIIYPVIATADISMNDIEVSPDEVDEAFLVPVNKFFNPEIKTTEVWKFKDKDVTVPFWKIHNSTPLWGATAMILSELLIISKPYFSE